MVFVVAIANLDGLPASLYLALLTFFMSLEIIFKNPSAVNPLYNLALRQRSIYLSLTDLAKVGVPYVYCSRSLFKEQSDQ